jgi:drug/metabolite transporter (DMT)-like permease
MTTHILIAAVLLLTVYGQLIIKARALFHASGGELVADRLWYLVRMFSDIGVLSGFAAAALAGACWMLAIDRTELNYAYPFMALTFVLVPIGSMIVFGERLPPPQIIGSLLIVAGVAMSAMAR